jgi:transposase InsO family protein
MTSLSDRQHIVNMIDEARAAGAALKPACEIVGIQPRTYYNWLRSGEVVADLRPTAERPEPAKKLTPEEKAAILHWVNQPQYQSQTPEFIVADLMDKEGLYIASESSFYRVMREHNQMKRRGRQAAPKSVKPPTSHTATEPNQVWTWDISWLPGPAKGTWYYLYLVLDIYDRSIVHADVYETEKAETAKHFIQQACWREHKVKDTPIVLHSDNGSPMKASTFQETVYNLGLITSYSRPRVSNDNPFSESLFKTIKYKTGFPYKGFSSLEEAQDWVASFVHWYNHEHKHSALGYVTPMDRRQGEAEQILTKRLALKEAAKARRPERWSGNAAVFIPDNEVHLNPDRKLATD